MTRKAYRRKIIRERRKAKRGNRKTHLEEDTLKNIAALGGADGKIILLKKTDEIQDQTLAVESPLERIKRIWKPKEAKYLSRSQGECYGPTKMERI